MPRPKATRPKASANPTTAAKPRKVNKSEWIRSQAETLSAKDVVEKAKAAGITLSLAQVYTTRSVAKRAQNKPKGPGRGRRAALPAEVSAASARGVDQDELAFRRLALSIGLRRAEAFLGDLKRGVGL